MYSPCINVNVTQNFTLYLATKRWLWQNIPSIWCECFTKLIRVSNLIQSLHMQSQCCYNISTVCLNSISFMAFLFPRKCDKKDSIMYLTCHAAFWYADYSWPRATTEACKIYLPTGEKYIFFTGSPLGDNGVSILIIDFLFKWNRENHSSSPAPECTPIYPLSGIMKT